MSRNDLLDGEFAFTGYRDVSFVAVQRFCPKCRNALVYVTTLPHPKASQMRKTTFVCYRCNRTWTYPLAAEIADIYAAEAQFEASA